MESRIRKGHFLSRQRKEKILDQNRDEQVTQPQIRPHYFSAKSEKWNLDRRISGGPRISDIFNPPLVVLQRSRPLDVLEKIKMAIQHNVTQ